MDSELKSLVFSSSAWPLAMSRIVLSSISAMLKEHPLNFNYKGIKDDRDWIFKPEQAFSSFFKHWNYVLKKLAY